MRIRQITEHLANKKDLERFMFARGTFCRGFCCVRKNTIHSTLCIIKDKAVEGERENTKAVDQNWLFIAVFGLISHGGILYNATDVQKQS